MTEPDNKANDDNHSTASRSSCSSSSSKAGFAIAIAKAKAEAAQVRAAHSQREIELKVEQARIQATLEALKDEKEQDAAIAEANTLEAGLLVLDVAESSRASNLILQSSQRQRTAAYVADQASTHSGGPHVKIKSDITNPTSPHASALPTGTEREVKSTSLPAHNADPVHTVPQHSLHALRHIAAAHQQFPTPVQQPVGTPYGAGYMHSQNTNDLAKYLARSQLVTSGLTTYDDQPINYWAWKTSFQNAISGLDLSAAEELDLLIKYLGKESSQHVKRIKAVNIRSSLTGLTMAWERLKETYGSPEAIEQALFSKLDNFPKITTKDPQRQQTCC